MEDRRRHLKKEQASQLKFITRFPGIKNIPKTSYYIAQIAVAKEAKGTGVMRKLLTPIFADCQRQNMDIVLETNDRKAK